MTRATTQLLVALSVCAILATLVPPPSVVVADDRGVGRLDPATRQQLRQQKAAKNAEEAEASDDAYKRWLRKIERDADSSAPENSLDEFDEESDDSSSGDFLDDD